MKVLGFTQSAFDPASRFRWIQMMPYLEKAGWEVEHRPNRPDRQWYSPLSNRLLRAVHYRIGRLMMKVNRWRDIRVVDQFDALFVNRNLAGAGLFLERAMVRRNPRFVFDFDDAIFLGRDEKAAAWMCAHAAWVTPGNEYLADFARRHTDRVTVVPTVIDTDTYAFEETNRESHGRVRIGWSGSDQSIYTTLMPKLPMLRRLQEKVPFELVVMSNTKPPLNEPGLKWTFIPWKADEEAKLGTRFDIGIMPLKDDDFQKGKCGLKLLQYMAAGLPTVSSPVGVSPTICQHGVTGFLADTDDEWRDAFEKLIQQPLLRTAMGLAGRQRCVDHYSIRRWLPTLMEILSKAAERRDPAVSVAPRWGTQRVRSGVA